MRSKKLPLVSVVMPVYNAGDFVVEAIRSIIKQTYKNIELIIVDDASEDNSVKIIDKYRKKYPRIIKLITLKKSLGKSGDPATNIAIKKAKGKYVAKMDADDISDPKRIAKQIEYLEKNKDVFLLGTQAYVINKHGEILGEKNTPLNHQEIYSHFFLYNYMIHPSIMFRNIKNKKDFYQIKFPFFNEYYTFFKLMNLGKKFANLNEKLLYYRIHGKNDTFSQIKKKFMSTLNIKKEFVFTFNYHPNYKDIIVTIAQSILVFMVPEKFTVYFYLLSRNVIKPQKLIKSFATVLTIFFTSIKQFSLSLVKMFI